LTGEDEETIEAHFAGQGYGNLKKAVAEAVIEELKLIQDCYRRMAADPGYIEQVLKDGADKLRPLAERRLRAAQENMGIR
jgi:tryptophanyl-tRNA synthetase